jgi:hypothetical protein
VAGSALSAKIIISKAEKNATDARRLRVPRTPTACQLTCTRLLRRRRRIGELCKRLHQLKSLPVEKGKVTGIAKDAITITLPSERYATCAI